MAYVNFERPDCAKSVRRSLLPRLNKVLGRNIAIDPAGVIRDQEGFFYFKRFISGGDDCVNYFYF